MIGRLFLRYTGLATVIVSVLILAVSLVFTTLFPNDTHCVGGICMPNPDQHGSTMQQASFYFTNLFDTSSFPARWFCGSWSGFHGWSFLIADIITFLSYFGIPIFILIFLKKRKSEEMPFGDFLNLAAIFILFCGLTHLFDSLTFWVPLYRLLGLVKIGTAGISFVTLIALTKKSSELFDLKTPTELRRLVKEQTNELQLVNNKLSEEIEKRKVREEELAESLYQNENLFREMHHRIKNNLQTIVGMLRIKSINPEISVLDVTRAVEKRVNQMGRLHNLLLNNKNIDQVNLEAYLREVIESVDESSEVNIRIHFEIEKPIQLQSEVALNLGMIVYEVCVNSMKHAFVEKKEGLISVRASLNEDSVILAIEDDGVGYDVENKVSDHGSGFGSLLIDTFARNIRGSRLVVNSDESGTRTTITLPINLSLT